MGSRLSGTGYFYPLFMVCIFLFRMVDAHAGIIDPKPMVVGKTFTSTCGVRASGIIKRSPFINQEAWKVTSPQCLQRRCQGLFVEDQNLQNIAKFISGQDIPVTIQVQVPHGGIAKLLLMDMTAQRPVQSEGSDLVLKDLGRNFGVPAQRRIQKFIVRITSEQADACQKSGGTCAIAFHWQVRTNEIYEICSLVSIHDA
ncbi:hypothetical protein PGT21_011729 [Puccinia graminis f. sp. tritici]|uniref:Uncharacterized protein n=1 Tax=Puccinia graminis f. sp. tritici TaxID=56615 RepID=A0A5B0P5K0_PUCGR|nr:hypothetical protein PGT21_011729 [Puccinia graminis f. sp. tritici]KAA1132141.1 hypothetical protein PGTUg99_037403 [Puccinia graminis f. sp. tritici]